MKTESVITKQPEAEIAKLGSSDEMDNRHLGCRKHFHPENVDWDHGTVSRELEITVKRWGNPVHSIADLLPFVDSVTLDRDRFLT